MRRRRAARGVVVALAAAGLLLPPVPAAAGPALDSLAGPPAAADLEVMTFNLRYAGGDWPQRRPVMLELLNAERPHVIGTQEGLHGQLDTIEAGLGPDYDRVGEGREGGTRGEHMAIFYDRKRLTELERQDFWLSDTPEVAGSNTWGGGSIRMVTWVRFLDKVTQGQFYAVNTHLDNSSGYARERAAGLIRDRLAALRPGLPIVLTGDFNSGPWAGNPVYDILVRQGGYVDTWPAAARKGPVYGTFRGDHELVRDGTRIDWVLTSPGVGVSAAAINTHRSTSGRYPSDHLPVQVRLRLPVATPAPDVTFVNRATGKCLDVHEASTEDGADVRQWSCNGGANQRWRVEPQGDKYRLINVGSGKALDVADCGSPNGTADGRNIQQWSWLDSMCQHWKLIGTDNGWVRLENPHSGKVADVADCQEADGTDVRLWTWLNNTCQQWQARS